MTSLWHRHFLTIILLIFLTTLSGCRYFLIPVPSNPNAVIVGIAVKELRPGYHSSSISKVYFVKIEENGPSDTDRRVRILESADVSLSSYALLINAEPGQYAAVGYRNSDRIGRVETIFFTQGLISRLTQTIAPGTVALLGDITVDIARLRQESDFDDVQQYYFKKIHKNDVRTALKRSTAFGTQYPLSDFSGSLNHESPLDIASKNFLSFVSRLFPLAWKPWIDKSVVQLAQ